MTVKAVTFDLWLTLIWDNRELEEYRKLRRLINFHRFAKKMLNGSESQVTFDDIRRAMEDLSIRAKAQYEKGFDIDPEERARMLFRTLGISLSPKEREETLSSAAKIISDSGYYAKYPNLNPEARYTLKVLKETYPGIKIGLISNAARSSRTYARMFRSHGIIDYFDNLTISCEVGFLKPRREIFESSLRALGVKPKDALHVGDIFKADVIGATSVGMNSALYTGLWHKYSQYMNPGEHIPQDFKPRKNIFVKEVESLREVVALAGEIRSN